MMTYLSFLIENNYNAAKYVAKLGYSKMLNNDYGIECKVDKNNQSYLEYKYKLDKSIC
jgi:hypothetical protein